MEKSGFFNSSGGDRVYNATDFAEYFGDLVSNGIFYKNADNLKVTAAQGMTVTVQAGSAWINGYHYTNTTPLELTLATANGVYTRYDYIVLRWSNVDRNITLAVKTGVASSSPNQPELIRTAYIWELCLASVYVYKGIVNIDDNAINDCRLYQDMCGLINSLVSAVYE